MPFDLFPIEISEFSYSAEIIRHYDRAAVYFIVCSDCVCEAHFIFTFCNELFLQRVEVLVHLEHALDVL